MKQEKIEKLKKQYLETLKKKLLTAKANNQISNEMIEKIGSLSKQLSHILDEKTYLNYTLPFFSLDPYFFDESTNVKNVIDEAIDQYNALIFSLYHDPENKKKLNI